MIRNLNQVDFRDYGVILPERGQKEQKDLPHGAGAPVLLSGTQSKLCRAVSDTWLTCTEGKSTLSVSADGDSFQHFYLDKTVCVRSGVLYCLSPFMGDAVVSVSAQAEPEFVKLWSGGSMRIDRGLHTEGLYTFFYQEKEQGFLFAGESHPMPELTYVDQGSLHSVAGGQDLLLKQGDVVLYAPDQWHMQYADVDVAPRFVTITFDMAGEGLEPLFHRKFAAPRQAQALLRQMLMEYERPDEYSNDIILSQLNLLLLTLLREVRTPAGGKLQASNAVRAENEIISRAQQYISANIRQKLSVPLVAQQVDVSPSYLTALFHKNLQISPGEYIRRIKLQESKQMIRENDLNFTEIAAALQYSTVHHFSRQFKEKFGITPTEYAKSVR